jgi:hypothetical protein
MWINIMQLWQRLPTICQRPRSVSCTSGKYSVSYWENPSNLPHLTENAKELVKLFKRVKFDVCDFEMKQKTDDLDFVTRINPYLKLVKEDSESLFILYMLLCQMEPLIRYKALLGTKKQMGHERREDRMVVRKPNSFQWTIEVPNVDYFGLLPFWRDDR